MSKNMLKVQNLCISQKKILSIFLKIIMGISSMIQNKFFQNIIVHIIYEIKVFASST